MTQESGKLNILALQHEAVLEKVESWMKIITQTEDWVKVVLDDVRAFQGDINRAREESPALCRQECYSRRWREYDGRLDLKFHSYTGYLDLLDQSKADCQRYEQEAIERGAQDAQTRTIVVLHIHEVCRANLKRVGEKLGEISDIMIALRPVIFGESKK
ncbi:hypothetical protein TWF696_007909 [Orbilia brochopaga]|uniref:DUF5082 domain-containing protein n=1 Tax=Orbilia brochopaga TaxID=3140254 RepID=A0AAV9UQB4_9PEZI